MFGGLDDRGRILLNTVAPDGRRRDHERLPLNALRSGDSLGYER